MFLNRPPYVPPSKNQAELGVSALGPEDIIKSQSLGSALIGGKRRRRLSKKPKIHFKLPPSDQDQRYAKKVRRVFVSRHLKLTRCYQRSFRNSPHFEGEVHFKLEITQSGKVKNQTIEYSSSFKSRDRKNQFKKCLHRAVRSLKFPRRASSYQNSSFHLDLEFKPHQTIDQTDDSKK